MRTYPLFRNVSAALVGLVVLAAASCSKSGRTDYYYPADLKTMKLPTWDVTNAIPLTPDRAVLAATRYLNTKQPDIVSWDVDRIELSHEFDSTWTYIISLTDRHSGRYDFEIVRVLMDGNVWKPSPERKQ
jgi:hypothetical protein